MSSAERRAKLAERRAAKRAELLVKRKSLQDQQDLAASLVEEADDGAQHRLQRIMQPTDYRTR